MIEFWLMPVKNLADTTDINVTITVLHNICSSIKLLSSTYVILATFKVFPFRYVHGHSKTFFVVVQHFTLKPHRELHKT